MRMAKRICSQGGVFSQIDTYFQVSAGRLKLREFSRSKAELIYYKRIEGKGERWSKYYISPVKSPSTLKNLLRIALGRRIVVRKCRRLFFYKGARIHIDSVFRLGHFIEIEVMVKKSRDEARSVFAEIIRLFNIEKDAVIACSYADLLEKKSKRGPRREKKIRRASLVPA
jgi:predicted adenylyl cyclase CyaB